jgi:D-alanyl-lipoteichoic acid acyltransferase DltB (MBOAT superfamily)
MLFNSAHFILFFGAFIILYYASRQSVRWLLLLCGSFYFYASANAFSLVLLIALTLASYLIGRLIARAPNPLAKRLILVAGVITVASALCFFKYDEFLRASLNAASTPDRQPVLGLSFYTFSCLSYLGDVYSERVEPERHLGMFAVYVAFFPKLLAGPLERSKPFLEQLRRPVAFDDARVSAGLQLMLIGLFKKVVIADRLAVFVDRVYRLPALSASADLVLATYFFAFQLYCDFSAYSDMAIGAAQVLGFDLVENFKRPYLSTSVREFWARRWHLSLSEWFRDFVYIPMGGSSRSSLRTSINLMLVFLLSGVWHGANWTFLIWGGLNGLYTVAERATDRIRGPRAKDRRLQPVATLVRRLVTFHMILITWIFFRAASLTDAMTILRRTAGSIGALPAALYLRLTTTDVAWSLALIVGLLLVETLEERTPVRERLSAQPVFVRWSAYYALLFTVIVFGNWGQRQFVYLQF